MVRLQPRKSLGQHFLIDPVIHARIVREFAPQTGDFVVEIGPGTGLLTRELLATPLRKLIAFELDSRAVPMLQQEFGTEGDRFEVREQDFLLSDLDDLRREAGVKLRVIGNIPYYITSPILFKLIDERHMVRDCMLLIQQEVAERLSAQPHTKAYGIPTVLANFFGEVQYLFAVPAHAFRPVPKVDSAVVRINFERDYFSRSNISRPPHFDEAGFRKLVRTSFGMRRKTMRNNLKGLVSQGVVEQLESGPLRRFLSQRAEELTINDFLEIFDAIQL